MRKKWIGLSVIAATAMLFTELPRSDYSLIQKILPMIQIGGTAIRSWLIFGAMMVLFGIWLLMEGCQNNKKRLVVIMSSVFYLVLILTAMDRMKSSVYELGSGAEAVEVLDADLTLYTEANQLYASVDVHLKCHQDFKGPLTMNTELPGSFMISPEEMNEEALTLYNIRDGDVFNINQVFTLNSDTKMGADLKEVLIYEDYKIILKDDANVVEVLMNEGI